MHNQKKEDKRRNNKQEKPEGKKWMGKKNRDRNGGNKAQKSYQWLVF